MSIDGILIGEYSLSESLTDDYNRFFAAAIRFLPGVELIEIAAGDDERQRGKKRERWCGTGARIFFAGRDIASAETEAGEAAASRQGTTMPKASCSPVALRCGASIPCRNR